MKNILAWTVAVALILTEIGCSTTGQSQKQLARVAKDWCMVVRASQVIPVYPLTEDLQPGDIFLVQTREEDQISLYKEKGFLPLDQLIARLQPTNYQTFYLNSYGIRTNHNTPYHWTFPDDPKNGITNAPRAAFPSYNFSVKSGGGINLALPVQGVPVALNLMGARSAQGSITIADAYTYGVDIDSLLKQVYDWSKTVPLDNYVPSESTNYIRVVSRVYLTGRVNISMFNDSAVGAAASGGASKPVGVLNLTTNDSTANYAAVLSNLNSSVESSVAPGGSLKFAAANSRSVSMAETFPRPLAIGYLGFDLPILPGGRLGSPVSTHSKITQMKVNPPRPTLFEPDDNNAKLIDAWVRKDAAHLTQLKSWLTEQGYDGHGITNILNGTDYTALRAKIVSQFQIQ
ncbi:MAG: hypothetical protein JWM68_2567 [Verrucomicrobiales bacterium]|nr:hypothetical protein [Verrucomicrobiales bacterium]